MTTRDPKLVVVGQQDVAGQPDGTPQHDGAPPLHVVGWREWIAIPEWGIARIDAKIDTGAFTSALHAEHLHYFVRDGVDMIRFKVHPRQRSLRHTVVVESPLIDTRVVRSSMGEEELRPVVRTHVELLGVCWPIEVTLARRKLMGYRMLLGREALRDRFIVDPSQLHTAGQPSMPLSDSRVRAEPRSVQTQIKHEGPVADQDKQAN